MTGEATAPHTPSASVTGMRSRDARRTLALMLAMVLVPAGPAPGEPSPRVLILFPSLNSLKLKQSWQKVCPDQTDNSRWALHLPWSQRPQL